jgi:hypothetical protein
MNNPTELKLIEGDFSAAEAQEILINVFSSKIQFHEMRNYSSMERFGKEDIFAKKRIDELKKCVEEFKRVVSEANVNNQQIQINSIIKISIK